MHVCVNKQDTQMTAIRTQTRKQLPRFFLHRPDERREKRPERAASRSRRWALKEEKNRRSRLHLTFPSTATCASIASASTVALSSLHYPSSFLSVEDMEVAPPVPTDVPIVIKSEERPRVRMFWPDPSVSKRLLIVMSNHHQAVPPQSIPRASGMRYKDKFVYCSRFSV